MAWILASIFLPRPIILIFFIASRTALVVEMRICVASLNAICRSTRFPAMKLTALEVPVERQRDHTNTWSE